MNEFLGVLPRFDSGELHFMYDDSIANSLYNLVIKPQIIGYDFSSDEMAQCVYGISTSFDNAESRNEAQLTEDWETMILNGINN